MNFYAEKEMGRGELQQSLKRETSLDISVLASRLIIMPYSQSGGNNILSHHEKEQAKAHSWIVLLLSRPIFMLVHLL